MSHGLLMLQFRQPLIADSDRSRSFILVGAPTVHRKSLWLMIPIVNIAIMNHNKHQPESKSQRMYQTFEISMFL